VRFVEETLADLKRLELTEIDIELLRLKQTSLGEKLDDLKSDFASDTKKRVVDVEQDMMKRGVIIPLVWNGMLLARRFIRRVETARRIQIERPAAVGNRVFKLSRCEHVLLGRTCRPMKRRLSRFPGKNSKHMALPPLRPRRPASRKADVV
jgi:hypothetical protein